MLRYRWRVYEMGYTWYAETDIRNKDGNYRCVRIHQLIMGQPPAGREVDHINGDGLNDRRSNLRWATHLARPVKKTSNGRGDRI